MTGPAVIIALMAYLFFLSVWTECQVSVSDTSLNLFAQIFSFFPFSMKTSESQTQGIPRAGSPSRHLLTLPGRSGGPRRAPDGPLLRFQDAAV